VWFEFAKVKRRQNNFAHEVTNFQCSQTKGFTVSGISKMLLKCSNVQQQNVNAKLHNFTLTTIQSLGFQNNNYNNNNKQITNDK